MTGFCVGANPGASFPDCDGGFPVATGTEKGKTKTNGSVYSASITKRLEKGSLSAVISRTQRPDLNGRLLDSNQLRLNGVYRLTEMLRHHWGFNIPKMKPSSIYLDGMRTMRDRGREQQETKVFQHHATDQLAIPA